MKKTMKSKVSLNPDAKPKIKQITHVYAFSEHFISGEKLPLNEVYEKYNLAQFGIEPIHLEEEPEKRDFRSFLKNCFFVRLLRIFYDGVAHSGFYHVEY